MKNFLFFIITVSAYLLNDSIVHGQHFDLDLKQTLVIGKAESDSTEYLFGRIRHVKYIGDDKILVSDRSNNSLRLFNFNGSFKTKFGSRGRGPGEFHEITSVEYDANGRIFITDRFQGRVTLFSDTGNLIDTKSLPVENLTNLQYVFTDSVSDNLYVGYRNHMGENDEGHFLHLFDSDLNYSQNQFLNVFNHFFNKEIPFEYRISTSPRYKAVTFGNSMIAVTPKIYTGTIGILNKDNQTESTIGEPKKEFYRLYDWKDRTRYIENDQVGFATTSGQDGNFLYRRLGSTFSLIGNKNFLLQFIGYFEGTIIRPHLKVYSAEGELLASFSLENHNIPFIRNNLLQTVIPSYLDNQNRLYIADMYYEEGGDIYPAVRVFETNLNELIDN